MMRFTRSMIGFSIALAFGGIAILPATAATAATATAASAATAPLSKPVVKPAMTTKASVLPAGVTLARNVEGIDEYALANGLRILLVPDASKPTTTVNITYRVGSRYENYGETGMAHLLEHLMFKGSKSHPRLWEEMSQHGVQFNGTTWLDRTNYYETFAAKPETLEWALAMEADRMVNSRISGDDLKTEFSVVRNEMEMRENDSVNILIERTIAAAYDWHNYGKSTIGARTDVENVNIPHLQNFWRKYYQPDNAVLVVAGAFDTQKTLALIAQNFGKIPRPSRQLESSYTLDPIQDGEREVTVRRVGDSKAVIALYHTVPAASPDYAASDALAMILGDSPNGRLYKALIESKKAVGVFPWAVKLEEPGYVLFGATLRAEQDLDEVQKIMIDTVQGLATNPITEAELARAKASVDNYTTQVFNDPEKFGVALSNNIGNGDWRLFLLNRDRMKALTVADVQRFATTWLKTSNRTVGRFIPDAAPDRVPAPAKVDVAKQMLEFKPGVAIAQAEAFVSTSDNIDQRTQTGALSNGLKYAFLPKTTRGNTVVMQLSLNLGNEQAVKGRTQAAELAASMLNRGTEKMTHQQFSEELDKLKANLSISGDATTATISVQTIRSNLPRVLDLVHDALRTPAFAPAEFTTIVNEQLAQLEEARKDPQAIASDIVQSKTNSFPPDDARYHRSMDETIAQLKVANVAEAKAFWQEFYGANNAQLSIVGDFDPVAIKAQLQTELGDWTTTQRYSRLPRPYVWTTPQSLTAITPDKANAFFFGMAALPIGDKHPDYAALTLGNYLLGGSMNSRILERIRQKDGVSYGGGSFFDASPSDEAGGFGVYAIFAPQNRAKLEAGLKEEIARAVKDGFTAAEIADGKKSLLDQMQLERSQDGALAHKLARNLYLGRSMKDDAELEQKIRSLTSADVTAAMQKYISFEKLITIGAGDFK